MRLLNGQQRGTGRATEGCHAFVLWPGNLWGGGLQDEELGLLTHRHANHPTVSLNAGGIRYQRPDYGRQKVGGAIEVESSGR